jgi:hypothetical protein
MSLALSDLTKRLLQSKYHWKIKVLVAFPEIIGATLKDHVSIIKITDNGTIVLAVSNSCLLQELRPFVSLLCSKINQILDNVHIIEVQFKLRGQLNRKKKPMNNLINQEHYTVITLESNDKKQLEKIKDPELRSVLETFALRCQRKRYDTKNNYF